MRTFILTGSLLMLALVLGCKGDSTPAVTPGLPGEVLERDATIPGSAPPSSAGSQSGDVGREVQGSGRAMDRSIPQ